MIDFHTHVLPDFDDGPKDDSESRSLVEALITQGVDTIVSTSHFYPDEESADKFIERRDAGFARLQELCKDLSGLTIIKGAEVYCDETLEVLSDFRGLTVGDTPTILIELSNVNTYSDQILRILKRLSGRFGLTPVIAHVERYPDTHHFTSIRVSKLIDAGCLIQINCDSVVGGKYNKIIRKLLDKGLVDVLGSDAHDTVRRPPHIEEAAEIIRRDYGTAMLDRLFRNAEQLIGKVADAEDEVLIK